MKKEVEITYTQLILMLLANSPTKCLSYKELMEKTHLNDNKLHVYLYRLKKKGIVKATWGKTENGRERIYCLKLKEQLLE